VSGRPKVSAVALAKIGLVYVDVVATSVSKYEVIVMVGLAIATPAPATTYGVKGAIVELVPDDVK